MRWRWRDWNPRASPGGATDRPHLATPFDSARVCGAGRFRLSGFRANHIKARAPYRQLGVPFDGRRLIFGGFEMWLRR